MPSHSLRSSTICALLILLAVYSGTNLFSPILFDREKIEVWQLPGTIHVRGQYHYQNRLPLPVSFSLGLPFPEDALHPRPTSYSVTRLSPEGGAGEPVFTRTYRGEVVFRLWFLPRQEQWIQVDYTQPALSNDARYVLLTTRAWHRPLSAGEYILHLENGARLTGSSYPVEQQQGGQTFAFSRTDFFPERDWTFSWSPPTNQSKMEAAAR